METHTIPVKDLKALDVLTDGSADIWQAVDDARLIDSTGEIHCAVQFIADGGMTVRVWADGQIELQVRRGETDLLVK